LGNWRSKFETRPHCTQVSGCIEPEVIANNFASYLSEIYALNNAQRASSDEYMTLRENYFGFPL